MLRKNLGFILKTFTKINNDRFLLNAKLCQPHLIINNRCSTQSHIVLMRGLDAEAKEEDVVNFFQSLNIKPINIHMKCDSAGRVTGTTEVEFATYADTVVAMRKRTAFIGNRFIRLTLKSSGASEESQKDASSEKLQENKHQHVKDGLRVDGIIERSSFPTGHFIRMKNIPTRVTDQAIFQFFRSININPVAVNALYDENGRRLGEFDVEFLTHNEAVQAMSKNNAYFGQKFVELILNSAPTPVPRTALDEDKTNLVMQKSTSEASIEQRSYKGG